MLIWSVRFCCARTVFGIVLIGLDPQATEACVAMACPKLMHFLIIVKYTKALDDPRMIRKSHPDSKASNCFSARGITTTIGKEFCGGCVPVPSARQTRRRMRMTGAKDDEASFDAQRNTICA